MEEFDIYLLFGLTKESRHWSPQFLQGLEDHLGPQKIHLLDLPGAGIHLDKKSPFKISDIVDATRDLTEFHPERKRLLVAISMGGMVAWDWTCRYPDDFHGLVMINSSLAGLSSYQKRLQPRAMLHFLKIALSPKGIKKEKAILELCSNQPELREKTLPAWTEIGENTTMSLPNSLAQLVAAARFKAQTAPQVRSLIIASKSDRLAHYTCSEDIAQFAKAPLVLAEEEAIGHAFHLDGAEFLVSAIRKWWKN